MENVQVFQKIHLNTVSSLDFVSENWDVDFIAKWRHFVL